MEENKNLGSMEPEENNTPDTEVKNAVAQENGTEGSKGFAIASLVLGIVSVVFCCCFYYISFPCAIVGIILGAISVYQKRDGKGMAIAGLVLSGVAIVLAVILVITAGAILASMPWEDIINNGF